MIGLNETALKIVRTYLFGKAHADAVPDLISSDRIRPIAKTMDEAGRER